MKPAIKSCLIIAISFLLLSCNKKDDMYYWDNPEKMTTALSQCPSTPPKGLSCAQLQTAAQSFRDLSIELQSDPQAYGKAILVLQQTITEQDQKLKNNPNQKELSHSLADNRAQVLHRLAVIRYHGSPGA